MRFARAALPLILAVSGSFAILTKVSAAPPADLAIARGTRLAVVTSGELPAPAKLALDDLSSYLQRTLQVVVRRYPPETRLAALDEAAAIVVGAAADPGFAPLLQQTKKDLPTAELGEEGARVA